MGRRRARRVLTVIWVMAQVSLDEQYPSMQIMSVECENFGAAEEESMQESMQESMRLKRGAMCVKAFVVLLFGARSWRSKKTRY